MKPAPLSLLKSQTGEMETAIQPLVETPIEGKEDYPRKSHFILSARKCRRSSSVRCASILGNAKQLRKHRSVSPMLPVPELSVCFHHPACSLRPCPAPPSVASLHMQNGCCPIHQLTPGPIHLTNLPHRPPPPHNCHQQQHGVPLPPPLSQLRPLSAAVPDQTRLLKEEESVRSLQQHDLKNGHYLDGATATTSSLCPTRPKRKRRTRKKPKEHQIDTVSLGHQDSHHCHSSSSMAPIRSLADHDHHSMGDHGDRIAPAIGTMRLEEYSALSPPQHHGEATERDEKHLARREDHSIIEQLNRTCMHEVRPFVPTGSLPVSSRDHREDNHVATEPDARCSHLVGNRTDDVRQQEVATNPFLFPQFHSRAGRRNCAEEGGRSRWIWSDAKHQEQRQSSSTLGSGVGDWVRPNLQLGTFSSVPRNAASNRSHYESLPETEDSVPFQSSGTFVNHRESPAKEDHPYPSRLLWRSDGNYQPPSVLGRFSSRASHQPYSHDYFPSPCAVLPPASVTPRDTEGLERRVPCSRDWSSPSPYLAQSQNPSFFSPRMRIFRPCTPTGLTTTFCALLSFDLQSIVKSVTEFFDDPPKDHEEKENKKLRSATSCSSFLHYLSPLHLFVLLSITQSLSIVLLQSILTAPSIGRQMKNARFIGNTSSPISDFVYRSTLTELSVDEYLGSHAYEDPNGTTATTVLVKPFAKPGLLTVLTCLSFASLFLFDVFPDLHQWTRCSQRCSRWLLCQWTQLVSVCDMHAPWMRQGLGSRGLGFILPWILSVGHQLQLLFRGPMVDGAPDRGHPSHSVNYFCCAGKHLTGEKGEKERSTDDYCQMQEAEEAEDYDRDTYNRPDGRGVSWRIPPALYHVPAAVCHPDDQGVMIRTRTISSSLSSELHPHHHPLLTLNQSQDHLHPRGQSCVSSTDLLREHPTPHPSLLSNYKGIQNNPTVIALLSPAGVMLSVSALFEMLAIWFTYLGLVALPFLSWISLNTVSVAGLGYLGHRILHRKVESCHRAGIVLVLIGCSILWVVHLTLITSTIPQVFVSYDPPPEIIPDALVGPIGKPGSRSGNNVHHRTADQESQHRFLNSDPFLEDPGKAPPPQRFNYPIMDPAGSPLYSARYHPLFGLLPRIRFNPRVRGEEGNNQSVSSSSQSGKSPNAHDRTAVKHEVMFPDSTSIHKDSLTACSRDLSRKVLKTQTSLSSSLFSSSSSFVLVLSTFSAGHRTLICIIGYLCRTVSVLLQELIQAPMGVPPSISASIVGLESFLLSILIVPLASCLLPGLDFDGTLENGIDSVVMLYNNYRILLSCFLFLVISIISQVAARNLLSQLTGLHLTLITFLQLLVALLSVCFFPPIGVRLHWIRAYVSIPLEVFGVLLCLCGLLIYASLVKVNWKKPTKHLVCDQSVETAHNDDQTGQHLDECHAYNRAVQSSSRIHVQTAVLRLPAGLPHSSTNAENSQPTTPYPYSSRPYTDSRAVSVMDPATAAGDAVDFKTAIDEEKQQRQWRWSDFQFPPSSFGQHTVIPLHSIPLSPSPYVFPAAARASSHRLSDDAAAPLSGVASRHMIQPTVPDESMDTEW